MRYFIFFTKYFIVVSLFCSSCVKVDDVSLSSRISFGEFEVTRPGEGANTKFLGTQTTISNDTIYLTIPYFYPESSDNEIDLSQIILRLPVSTGLKVEPILGTVMDLRNPIKLIFTAQDNSKKEYTLVAKKVSNLNIQHAKIEFLNSEGINTTKQGEIIKDSVIFLINKSTSDLSKVKLFLDINKHAISSIPYGTEVDLTKDVILTLTGTDKSQKTYTLKTKMPKLLPYGIGERQLLWKKDATQITNFPADARSITVSGNYFILVDGSKTGAPYLIYNRMNGEYVKELANPPIPAIRTMTMANDSLGHFIVSSWSGGNGNYKVYLYRHIEDTPTLLIDWKVDDGIGIGRRLNIYGDLTKNAEIIATSGGVTNQFRRWILRDGQIESNTPEKISYNTTSIFWDGTEVQPVNVSSQTKKSNYFISLFGVDGFSEGTRGIQWADGTINSMITQFRAYPSVDGTAQISLEYIHFNNAYLLSNIKFTNYDWKERYENVNAELCLFDVTNKSYYSSTPDDALFNRFLLFTSPTKLSIRPDNNPRDGRGNADLAYCFSDDKNSLFIYMVLTDGGILVYQFTKYSS